MPNAALGAQLDDWRRRIRPWAELWGCTGLEQRIGLQVSSRLRTTLGRCAPRRREVRIASFLLDAPDALLDEVLCHESAHVAVYELHGPGPRPHGAEWRTLMRAAGFEARVSLALDDLHGLPESVRRARAMWEHRCPVCHARSLAGRPVRQWRCAQCRESGLDGRLIITRMPAPSRGDLSAPPRSPVTVGGRASL
jgi:predicted SprT family Zn-dependent metalloprotease